MATKSGQQEPEKAGVIEELLDALDTSLDRVKVLYEQYFLGIQKQPPTYLHTDIERKIRDLAQLQIRNTALRYRFVTLQQKFGSYHAYWRRTLRQIENGTYVRSLQKIGRQVARTGADVPEEILAAMPKRMRDRVKRDREAALALARLRDQLPEPADDTDLLTLEDDVEIDLDDLGPAAFIGESTDVRRNMLAAAAATASPPAGANGGAHRVDEADADFDLDAFFAAVTNEGELESLPSASRAVRPVSTPVPVVRTPPRPPHEESPTQAASPLAANLKLPGADRPASLAPASLAPARPAPARPSAVGNPAAANRTAAMTPAAANPVAASPVAANPAPAIPAAAKRAATAAGSPAAANPAAASPAGAPPAPTTSIEPPKRPMIAPSQAVRPLPIIPGTAAARGPVPVDSLSGPFPRIPPPAPASNGQRLSAVVPVVPPIPRPPSPPAGRTPPSLPTSAGDRAGVPERLPAERTPPPVRAPVAAPGERTALPVERAPLQAGERMALPIQPAAMPERTPPPPPPPPLPRRGPPAYPPGMRAGQSPSGPLPVADTAASTGVPRRPEPPRAAAPRPAVSHSEPEPRQAPPPGMSDADVNALYTKYVQAKQILGEDAGPGAYGKLLKTINAQAPKIMEQYKSAGVDFSVVVKDNQVVIRAKPKP